LSEQLLFFLAGAYLLGSIPFALIIYYITDSRDIRREGSGNIGATNIFRLKGLKLGILTLLVDMAKGIVPLLVARHNLDSPNLVFLVGAAAVFGHMFPLYLLFRGGKGVATFLGVTGVFFYPAFGVFLALFFAVVYFSRLISLASLTAVAGVFFLFLFTQHVWISLVTFLLGLLIVYRHRENIDRLLKGEEHRIGQKKG
jgi:glycerol-3-phosphate acyltransferase PlsY